MRLMRSNAQQNRSEVNGATACATARLRPRRATRVTRVRVTRRDDLGHRKTDVDVKICKMFVKQML